MGNVVADLGDDLGELWFPWLESWPNSGMTRIQNLDQRLIPIYSATAWKPCNYRVNK